MPRDYISHARSTRLVLDPWSRLIMSSIVRILLLNQYYPPDVAPTGRFLHDLARTLVARGHEVHAVCSQRSYDSEHRYPPRKNLDGVQVRRVPAFGFGRGGALRRMADYASFHALAYWAALRMPRPDIVLALTTPPYLGLTAAAVARIRGSAHAHWVMDVYPDVMGAHGMVRPNGLAARALAACARRQFAGARCVMTLGPCMAEKLEAYTRGCVESVPLWGAEGLTPCTVGNSNAMRQQRGWASDKLVLMYSGNMGLGHTFTEFLSAASRLGASGPIWAFVGGGPRRREIEEHARRHPEAQLTLLPYACPEDLRENLCSGDVQLASLSSDWQGLIVPSKIQSIFAVGKPVIFVAPPDNEIARWIQESGGGWCVGEGDVKALLKAVDEASDSGERDRRGAAALRFAQERFDRGRNTARLADLIETAGASGVR